MIPRSKGLMVAINDANVESSPRVDIRWQSYTNSQWINGLVRKDHDPWHFLGHT